ncbi:MAG: fumarate reductase/succinate dehydrogenase flavoprotein subunit, partial [Propionibacteriaceae bacterium]
PYPAIDENTPEVKAAVDSAKARIETMLSINGERTVDDIHKELGQIMWEYCGMERREEGLKVAIGRIRKLRDEFWKNVKVTGVNEDFNQALERAGRLADFLELGELMCIDALHRRESCGGHFRAESQTEEGEAKRDDENFLYVAAWEFAGDDRKPVLHKEPLIYKAIELKQRSYK